MTALTDVEHFCPSRTSTPVREAVITFSKDQHKENKSMSNIAGMQSTMLAFADKNHEHDDNRDSEDNGQPQTGMNCLKI